MPRWALYVGGAAILAYLLLRPRTATAQVVPKPSGTGAQIGNLVDGVVKLFQ